MWEGGFVDRGVLQPAGWCDGGLPWDDFVGPAGGPRAAGDASIEKTFVGVGALRECALRGGGDEGVECMWTTQAGLWVVSWK
jgi:hypothetical protein